MTTEDYQELPKSKSQVKREMQALRDLGKQLVDLPAGELKKFAFSDSLHDAILLAQHSKREALRRQLQHIGKLLREENEASVRQTLAQISQPKREEVQTFHEIEQWRDRLLDGDDEAVNLLVSKYPDADRQHLRQLARNARKEREQDKPPRSARLLFQYISDLMR